MWVQRNMDTYYETRTISASLTNTSVCLHSDHLNLLIIGNKYSMSEALFVEMASAASGLKPGTCMDDFAISTECTLHDPLPPEDAYGVFDSVTQDPNQGSVISGNVNSTL